MLHIPNAKHQMKSIILTLMVLVSFLLYDATDGYHAVQLTEAQQQEHQRGILITNNTTPSNATNLTPTELFPKVQDSVVRLQLQIQRYQGPWVLDSDLDLFTIEMDIL